MPYRLKTCRRSIYPPARRGWGECRYVLAAVGQSCKISCRANKKERKGKAQKIKENWTRVSYLLWRDNMLFLSHDSQAVPRQVGKM